MRNIVEVLIRLTDHVEAIFYATTRITCHGRWMYRGHRKIGKKYPKHLFFEHTCTNFQKIPRTARRTFRVMVSENGIEVDGTPLSCVGRFTLFPARKTKNIYKTFKTCFLNSLADTSVGRSSVSPTNLCSAHAAHASGYGDIVLCLVRARIISRFCLLTTAAVWPDQFQRERDETIFHRIVDPQYTLDL